MKSVFRSRIYALSRSSIPRSNPPLLSSLQPSTSFLTILPSASSYYSFSRFSSSSALNSQKGDYVSPPPSDIKKLFVEKYQSELKKYSYNFPGACIMMMYVIRSMINSTQEALFSHGFCSVQDTIKKGNNCINELNHCFLHISVSPLVYHVSQNLCADSTRNSFEIYEELMAQRQAAVSMLAFVHWLETGNLISHEEISAKLGLNSQQGVVFPIKDYLLGICLMSSKLPGYAEQQVTGGDYDCPRKVLKLLKDIQALFAVLDFYERTEHYLFFTKLLVVKMDVERMEEICKKLNGTRNDKIEDFLVFSDQKEMKSVFRSGIYALSRSNPPLLSFLEPSPPSDIKKLFEEKYKNELLNSSYNFPGVCIMMMHACRSAINVMQETLFNHGFCSVQDTIKKGNNCINELKHWLPHVSISPFVDHVNQNPCADLTRASFEYFDELMAQRQAAVSILAFVRWLETGNLILHEEISEKLGLGSHRELAFHIKDYFLGICLMSSKLPGYAEQQLTGGDNDCPRKVLKLLKDI